MGRCLGAVPYALCASPAYLHGRDPADLAAMAWIAPDEFLPNHPSVVWRRQRFPALVPAYRCNSMLAVAQMARAGLGVAALPRFLIEDGLQPLEADLSPCDTALWLLTRPDCRALRSVVTLFDELGRSIRLGP